MTHDLSELNQYTGFLMGLCFIALFLCLSVLGKILNVVALLREDYRKMSGLGVREKMEAEFPDMG